MSAALIFAFTAGAVATVNPCGFALLPVWFAQRLAEGGAAGRLGGALRALRAGVAATLGFLVIFGLAGALLGVGLGLGAAWLGPALPVAGLFVGIVVVLAGLASLTGIGARHLPGAKLCRRLSDRHGALVFGIGYGLVSLSCTLPIFLAAVGVALTQNPLAAAFNLLAYAAGMGTVLSVVGLGAVLAGAGFGASFGPLSGRARLLLVRLSAGLVIAAGIYVTFYWARVIFGDVMVENRLVSATEALATQARGWLSSGVGRRATGLAFGGLGLLAILGAGLHLQARRKRR